MARRIGCHSCHLIEPEPGEWVGGFCPRCRPPVEATRIPPGPKRQNLAGRRFGRLTVLAYSHTHGKAYWTCQCVCGRIKPVRIDKLLAGRIISCGCARADSDIRADAAANVSREDKYRRSAKGGRIAHRKRVQARKIGNC